MTSRQFIDTVSRLKRAWRQGMLTDDEFQSKMTELRRIYYRMSAIRLGN